ncbi:hypothetical protein HHI36_019051 [Cryptolaemus montrouzieri]|uniref:Uncharacterized protein n=1 Tax=Cryptolaemus montrouzieri TaxID=559131 RepID=A0ABD2P2I5_9CUCU
MWTIRFWVARDWRGEDHSKKQRNNGRFHQKKIESSLKKQNDDISSDIESEVGELRHQLVDYKQKTEKLESENEELKKRLEIVDRKTRKNNLVIYGLKTTENAVSDVYKIGKTESCPVLLELLNRKLQQQILQNSYKLKGSNISLSPDYTPEERRARKILVVRMREAKEEGKSAYIRGNTLIVENTT